ncbi:MAG: hypothetical protein JOZ96_11155 [Acidobacteria bacterium]|nr:hypothetical protein [Acidobacteriota bacterium]
MPNDQPGETPTNGKVAATTTMGDPQTESGEASTQSDEKPQQEQPPQKPPQKPPVQPPANVGTLNAGLLKSIQDRQEELLKSLSTQPRMKRMRLWERARDLPELLNVYGIIYNRLDELQRVLTERTADPPPGFDAMQQQLLSLLEKGKDRARMNNIHAAWEFAGSLLLMLLALGDDNYVITRLNNEQEREQKKQSGSWSEYLDIKSLTDLIEKFTPGDPNGQRDLAVESLALIYTRRMEVMRARRAGEELKADYLYRLAFILAVLLFLLIEAIHLASAPDAVAFFSQGGLDLLKSVFSFKLNLSHSLVRRALAAVVMGALGSILSGFYKLRDDETGSITTLRAFHSAMWAQPFVGATAAVLMMLLIMSGLFLPGTLGEKTQLPWMPLAIYCFLAGFSEPFFLGVVQRVAGAADKNAQSNAASAVNPAGNPTGNAGGKPADPNKP